MTNPEQIRATGEKEGCLCRSCNERYRLDFLVDDELWKRIAGPSEECLCGRCIANRIELVIGFGVFNIVTPASAASVESGSLSGQLLEYYRKRCDEHVDKITSLEAALAEAKEDAIRLRNRTHEIQEEESKRLAEMQQRDAYWKDVAKKGREALDLYGPASWTQHSAITVAIAERDQARADLARVTQERDAWERERDKVDGWLIEAQKFNAELGRRVAELERTASRYDDTVNRMPPELRMTFLDWFAPTQTT